jgi:putative oxidoreductase
MESLKAVTTPPLKAASPSDALSLWASQAPQVLSLLRMAAAFMFILHGTAKLDGFPAVIGHHGATARLWSEAWFAGVLETFGGGLVFIGLFTRPVAFLLAGEMAIAYVQVHLPRSVWPTLNGGVPAALYCFVWLYFSAAGAGPWSVDARRRA